jgi:histidyl-tRNA synthetase
MSSGSSFSPPRGMRDFYPEEMAAQNVILRTWRSVSESFGFEEYDACIVENLDLLKRKSGEDIVKQIYAFEDKSGRELALRPEMTPTLARMIAARQGALAMPLKWYTIAQCFRYERMTRGRRREHYQWNMDIVGEPSVSAEAEVITAVCAALSRLGLSPTDFVVRINNRALVAAVLASLGVDAAYHATMFLVLDKRDKTDDLAALLDNANLPPDAAQAVDQLAALRSLDDVARLIGEDAAPIQSLRELIKLLELSGLTKSVAFDMSVVRGLDYYTGIVFEGNDAKADMRAIFGGGRYDNLLKAVGGKPASGVGLGFGDVVIHDLLADKNLLPGAAPVLDVAIGYMGIEQRSIATGIASTMRTAGSSVDLGLHAEKAKQFFSRVGNGRARQAIFLGPDDLAAGEYRIKNLEDRTEKVVPFGELSPSD